MLEAEEVERGRPLGGVDGAQGGVPLRTFANEVIPEGEVSEEAAELAREYRAVLENILLSRGAGRI